MKNTFEKHYDNEEYEDDVKFEKRSKQNYEFKNCNKRKTRMQLKL